jgi:hypothetical protein
MEERDNPQDEHGEEFRDWKPVKAEAYIPGKGQENYYKFVSGPTRPDVLRSSIRPYIGWGYTEFEVEQALNAKHDKNLRRIQWKGLSSQPSYYPEVDGLGNLTGDIIDDDNDDYIIIEDQVMINKYTLSGGELKRLRAGEFPVWEVEPGPGLH